MAISHVKSNAIADFTGTITGFNSQGSTVTIAATDLVRPVDWNSAHNQFYTLSGNTTNASTASGTNVVFQALGNLTLVGSTGTIGISAPQPYISSYVNFDGPLVGSSGRAVGGQSNSDAIAFLLPQPGSFSFIRLRVLMTTNSTTYGTSAASMSASAAVYSTWNAMVYSLGTGASSQSLMSVASGSAGATQMQSISVAANGTQYSVSQFRSYFAAGNTTNTYSTQYSVSNTNYSFRSDSFLTAWSSARFLDIPFANSLSAGPYWLVFGYSTSSATNSTGISLATNCNVSYSNHTAASQNNVNFGEMGQTNFTSGGRYRMGSFSTAGGGTTTAFPYSAISSVASSPLAYFEMLRSA